MDGLCNLALIMWQRVLPVTDGLSIKPGAKNKVSSPTRELLGWVLITLENQGTSSCVEIPTY